jgi:hypothetical protein
MTPPTPDSARLATLWSAGQARVLALVTDLGDDDGTDLVE